MSNTRFEMDDTTSDLSGQRERPRALQRRTVLASGAVFLGVSAVGYRVLTAGPATLDLDLVPIDVESALPVPPLLEDLGDGISLRAAESNTSFIDGVASRTWGFNQPFLGPTIRLRRGERVPVTVTNELDEAITSHWHGLHVPGAVDGGPFNLIQPGESWDLTLDIVQQASTNWYHSHVHGNTGRQVYLGLAGMLLVDDDDADAMQLPGDYGIDDIPLILQDRTFLEDGSLLEINGRGVFLGEIMLVNGALRPVVDLQAKRNRFRVLNAANARIFNLVMGDGSPMVKIASEGGLLNAPVAIDSLRLSPGERAEIVIDLTEYAPGDEVVLRSTNVNGDGAMEDEFDVVRIRIIEQTSDNPPLPTVMNDVPDATELLNSVTVAATRDFALRGGAINGDAFDHDVINHVTERGTWEVWNITGGAHPFHVHGCSFLLLPPNGGEVAPEDAGWRDTVPVGNGVQLLMRFDHEAPVEATYMYHCHLMGHEDAGMMGQFAVVEDPGTVELALASHQTSSNAAAGEPVDADVWYCDLTAQEI